jgi:hypothetical protein
MSKMTMQSEGDVALGHEDPEKLKNAGSFQLRLDLRDILAEHSGKMRGQACREDPALSKRPITQGNCSAL